MWFYYQMMNSLHVAGQNAFSHQLIANYSQYLTTGIYQFGSSLSLTQRLFIFPYFTTYFYFFVVITSTHEILIRYIKTSWKQWTILVLLCLTFLFVYWFLNWQSYVILVGNIESAFLLLLILIPSFIHFDQSNTRLFILFLFLGYLFYDETCILVNIIYTFSFLLFLLVFRKKKYRISISYFLISCSIFILCSYLILYFAFTLKTNLLIKYDKEIFIVLVFLIYLEIIALSLYILDYYIKFKFIRNSKYYCLINKVWTHDYVIAPLKSKLQNNPKNNLIIKILLFVIVLLILVFAVYDFKYESMNYWQIVIIQSFTLACFIFITYFIVFKKVRSAFTYYFFILMFFAFVFDCVGFTFSNPYLSWIIERLTYIGLNPTYLEEGSIKNVVLLMYFCLLIVEERNWQFRIVLKCRKMFSKALLNADVLAITSSLVLISIIPATNAALDGVYYLNVVNIQDSNLLGINSQTWNKLAKINFDDKLTFCDFYLPIANATITYNIQHVLYPAYGDLKDFYNYKLDLYHPFYTINGKRIEDYNSQTFTNEILPYYNYVVIKDNDKFMENILKKRSYLYIMKWHWQQYTYF